MIQYQKGVATLLITTILLSIALVVTLGSYKNLFYQIKRAQNEVKARQEHWLAEGGLECGYSQFLFANGLPGTITDCGSGLGVIPQFSLISSGYKVTSHYGYASLVKDILISGNMAHGAIQSASDIYVRGSVNIVPDPGAFNSEGWECIALRYKNIFDASGAIQNDGVLIPNKPPYTGFVNPTGKDCQTTHKSSASGSLPTGSDFVKQPEMSLFEEFFDVSEEQHEKIKNNPKFTQILAPENTNGQPNIVPDCGKEILEQIENKHYYLWIEGGCELNGIYTQKVSEASKKTPGVLILVHEGIFSVMGNGELKGVLFHFNKDYVPSTKHWASFEANAYLNHNPSVIPDSFRTIASYYQHGSFTVTGGQFLDSAGQAAAFNNSLVFNFNKDVIDHIASNFVKPRWKEGSWNAQ
ncbi:hypothetical protein ACEZLA_002800 [Vibrio cholerae]|nr:hypothetical protein [Vibrio cholerae]